MSETEGSLNTGEQKSTDKYGKLLWFIAIVAIIILLIVRYSEVFWNSCLVALGFGAVIMVHEFGHFIVAKLSGIKVEAFSIGFPPVVFGIQRVENGWRVRVLPEILKKEGTEEGQYGFTIPASCRPAKRNIESGLYRSAGL